MFVIMPWIIGIFILMIMLIVFMMSENHRSTIRVDFEHIGMMIVYFVLFLLAVFNPIISWTIALNYLVNIAWSASIIYFKAMFIHHYSTEVSQLR